MFYTFDQNNSGGEFSYDPVAGITHIVIVEADSAKDANERAMDIGIYFNGCETGSDCSCCGDRWYAVNESDTANEPSQYGVHIRESLLSSTTGLMWMPSGREAVVHYKSGRKVWHGNQPRIKQMAYAAIEKAEGGEK